MRHVSCAGPDVDAGAAAPEEGTVDSQPDADMSDLAPAALDAVVEAVAGELAGSDLQADDSARVSTQLPTDAMTSDLLMTPYCCLSGLHHRLWHLCRHDQADLIPSLLRQL